MVVPTQSKLIVSHGAAALGVMYVKAKGLEGCDGLKGDWNIVFLSYPRMRMSRGIERMKGLDDRMKGSEDEDQPRIKGMIGGSNTRMEDALAGWDTLDAE